MAEEGEQRFIPEVKINAGKRGDVVIQKSLSSYVAEIEATPTFAELNLVLRKTRAALGFDHYLFLQFNKSRTDSRILLQDYPETWVELQRETMGFLRSPMVQAASQAPTPFRWSELGSLIELTDIQKHYLSEACEHGMAEGYTIPIHARGIPSAMFNFVSGPGKQIDASVLPAAMFVASRSYLAANRICNACAPTEQSLSDHDMRIVTLLCRGQGKSHIAQKLEIGQKDVTAAVNRACRHYRAGNQTEMVVQALWHQNIRFEDVIR